MLGGNMARNYGTINGTYSGVDMVVNIIFPGMQPIAIGNLSTLTYSMYRDKKPVRTIGRINPKGFAHGGRTIAGTLIFSVMFKHNVNDLKKDIPYLENIKKLKPCELPPFDILITTGNEYGASAHMAIYGVTIVDEGMIFSVEDLFTENTWTYFARDIDLLNDIGSELNANITSLGEYDSAAKLIASELKMDDDYVAMKQALQELQDEQKKLVEDLRKNATEALASTLDNVIDLKEGDNDFTIEEKTDSNFQQMPDDTWNENHEPPLDIECKAGMYGNVGSNQTIIGGLLNKFKNNKENKEKSEDDIWLNFKAVYIDDNNKEKDLPQDVTIYGRLEE